MSNEERGRELLAEFEKRIRMVRISDLDGTQRFAVEALNGDGRIVDSTRYAHDEFPLAASDYNNRTIDSLEPSAASAIEVGLRSVGALAEFDLETLADLLHDDFVATDHRPIGYPNMNRTQFLDVVTAQTDAIQVWLTQTLHAARSTAWLNSGGYWTINFGDWSPFEHGIYLIVVNNGQLARQEVYPDNQLDAAMTQFGKLTASSENTR